MVIGIVVDDTVDKPDGVQQYVQIMGRWLSQQGHEVHYLAGESSRTDIPNIHSLAKNVRVRFNGNRLTIPLPASKRAIRQLFSETHFDVLHVMMPHSPFLAGRVVRLAPADTAVVGTFHILPNSWFVGATSRLLKLIDFASLRRFQSIVAVSPAAAVFARQCLGREVGVLPNVIEVPRFQAGRPLAKYQDKLTLVYVNRLEQRKGCIYLLQAVNELVHNRQLPVDFRVVVCGKGQERDALGAYVRQSQLEHIVEFTGYISEEDKPNYIASADIAVYPSTGGESFGIVLLEAMAAAKGPVIAGDNPGYRSVLEPHTDQVVDPHDTQKFADLLATFLQDQAARARAREWQQAAIGNFDVDVVGKKLVALYEQARNVR